MPSDHLPLRALCLHEPQRLSALPGRHIRTRSPPHNFMLKQLNGKWKIEKIMTNVQKQKLISNENECFINTKKTITAFLNALKNHLLVVGVFCLVCTAQQLLPGRVNHTLNCLNCLMVRVSALEVCGAVFRISKVDGICSV